MRSVFLMIPEKFNQKNDLLLPRKSFFPSPPLLYKRTVTDVLIFHAIDNIHARHYPLITKR